MHRPLAPTDSSEFRDFLQTAKPKIRRMLMAYGVPLADAGDVAQDALLVFVRDRHRLDEIANHEAWLLGILRLTIYQYFRRQLRDRLLRDSLALAFAAVEVVPQEHQDSAHDLAALTAALGERDRLALWLHYGLELGPRDAAGALGCQPDSVRKLAQRALARVRRRLASAAAPAIPPPPPGLTPTTTASHQP